MSRTPPRIRALAHHFTARNLGLVPRFDDLMHDSFAWLCGAFHALAAYQTPGQRNGLVEDCGAGCFSFAYAPVEPWSNGNAHGHLLKSPNQLTVAIAGSDDWEDWRNNFLGGWVPLDDRGRRQARTGFVVHADLVSAVLHNSPTYRAARRIVFVGHSLGGAVAQLLAEQANRTPGVTARALVFNSPRAGNAAFARELRRRVRHVWNIGDAVPHGPSSLKGNRHVPGAARFLACDGSIYRSRWPVWADLALRGSARALVCRTRFVKDLKRAHSITEAIYRLAMAVLD